MVDFGIPIWPIIQHAALTDPYDDPERNYFDPAVWAQLPWWAQTVMRANNTIAGRLVLGPLIWNGCFPLGRSGIDTARCARRWGGLDVALCRVGDRAGDTGNLGADALVGLWFIAISGHFAVKVAHGPRAPCQ